MRRKLTAIMAADVAGFARITAEDEEETLARLASYRQVIDEVVIRAGGRVFNSGGDSVMCEFPSVVEATRCAIDIQEILRTRNLAHAPGRQMHFRIGISIGDVVERDGDLLGDGVNIAARLQALAEPGSICVSRNVQEAVSNKISLPFRDLGFREVKNLPNPVHVFQIDVFDARAGLADAGRTPVPAAAQALAGQRLARHRPFAPLVWLVGGLAIAAAGAGLFRLGQQDRTPAPPVTGEVVQSPVQPERAAAPGTSLVVTGHLTPAEAFGKLARSGGLVTDAASPVELYHNARIFEARGESANARRDYLALAALGTGYIDPLLRLAALIRAQDGRAGAREVMAGFAAGPEQAGRLAARLVHILQFDGAERTGRLSAFAEANPGFAPAQHFLAVELGDDRQNTQTIGEKRRERAALERFLEAEREGRLVPHVLDQSVLAGWLERAQKRDAELRAFFAEGRDRISLQLQRANAGWLGSVSLPEAAIRLEYRVDAGGDFQTTGLLQALDPRTGRPMPNPGFGLPPDQRPTTIALRYVDAMGVPSAVTHVPFDPATAPFLAMRQQLEQNPGAWLAYGDGQNRHHLYFTHLLSHRCAIARVEIGFNGEAPRQVIALPPCDPANPLSIPATARTFIALTPDTGSTTIRLTFVGGEMSDIRTYPRPK